MMKKILTVGLITAVLTSIVLFVVLRRTLEEKSRLRANNTVLMGDFEQEKTRNNEMMVKIDALELSSRELKQYYSSVVDELKNINVKLRKMTGYSTTATETVYKFHTEFKDSVIRDTIKIEKLEYKTEWVDLEVIKEGANAQVLLSTKDSLIQVVYWERSRRFLFIRFGRKEYSQKIRTKNPHSTIVYSEFIIPRKR